MERIQRDRCIIWHGECTINYVLILPVDNHTSFHKQQKSLSKIKLHNLPSINCWLTIIINNHVFTFCVVIFKDVFFLFVFLFLYFGGWGHTFLSNTNIFLNRSVWTRDWILTGTTTQVQSGPGSNDNEWVLHTPRCLELEALHQVQFSFISRTPNFLRGSYSCREYNSSKESIFTPLSLSLSLSLSYIIFWPGSIQYCRIKQLEFTKLCLLTHISFIVSRHLLSLNGHLSNLQAQHCLTSII